MKYRYVLKNKNTGATHFKWYTLRQIEDYALSGLFDIENYDIISRDRYTEKKDKAGKDIYEGCSVIIDTISSKERKIVYRRGGFRVEYQGEHHIISYSLYDLKSNELEVISTIHDK